MVAGCSVAMGIVVAMEHCGGHRHAMDVTSPEDNPPQLVAEGPPKVGGPQGTHRRCPGRRGRWCGC